MIVLKHSFVCVFALLHVAFVSTAKDLEITPICTKHSDDDLEITDFAYQNLWRKVTDEAGTQENGTLNFTYIKVKMACFATDFTAMKQGTVEVLEKKRKEIDRLIADAKTEAKTTLPLRFSAAVEYTTTMKTTDLHVMFDDIILNDGDAYKNVSGEFVAPDDATYQFQILSIFPEEGGSGGDFSLHIQVNGSTVKSFTELHPEKKVAALSAILTPKAGTPVRVAMDCKNFHKKVYMTFSGYKLD